MIFLDEETFKCLSLCKEAALKKGNSGAIINGANEIAVERFLAGTIKFLDIYNSVKYAFDNVDYIEKPNLQDIFDSDIAARNAASFYINEVIK